MTQSKKALPVLFREQDGVCYYCNNKAVFRKPNMAKYNNPDTATIDHVVPKSKGGKNIWNNYVMACKKCNNEKADKIW